MKRWLVLLLTAVILLSLAACGSSGSDSKATEPADVTLTSGGVSITLPAGYTVEKNASGNTNVVAVFSGEKGYVGIYVTRESLTALGKDESYTAADYVADVRGVTQRDSLSEVQTKNGLPYFTYTEAKDAAGTAVTLQYLNVGYRSGDSCYLVQFFCNDLQYEKLRDNFLNWAGTVTFA